MALRGGLLIYMETASQSVSYTECNELLVFVTPYSHFI